MPLRLKKPRRWASWYPASASSSGCVNRSRGVAVATAAILGTDIPASTPLGVRVRWEHFEHTARAEPMPLFSFAEKSPSVHPTAFIPPTAVLFGHVPVEENATVWYDALLPA